MNKKFFSEKQIYLATFFGGPLPAGILIHQNLKKIEEDRKASLALLLTVVFTFALFFLIFQIPDVVLDKIPGVVFTSLYTILVYLVYRGELKDRIEPLITSKEEQASNWRVFGLTMLGFTINMTIILLFALAEPAFPGEKYQYGAAKHEIFYEPGEFTETELEISGVLLEEIGYFNEETMMSVRLEKSENGFLLILPMSRQFWVDLEIIEALNLLKSAFTDELGKPVTIRLEDYDLAGETFNMDI